MFKIVMDDSLIERIIMYEKRISELLEKQKNFEKEKEIFANEKVEKLRNEMKEALIKSDLDRNILESKIEVYEKIIYNINIVKNQVKE